MRFVFISKREGLKYSLKLFLNKYIIFFDTMFTKINHFIAEINRFFTIGETKKIT